MDPHRPSRNLKARLKHLYYGDGSGPRLFRYGLAAFDLITIALFFLSTFEQNGDWHQPLDIAIGILILLEFLARLWVTTNKKRLVFSWLTLADVIVIASLLIPAVAENWGFLRILRAVRLLRSYHMIRDLRQDSRWFSHNQEVMERGINFTVFLFMVTSFVFVTQRNINPDINTYIDALYFSVTTLTTTGFGDITLKGPWGRLEAVVIMIIGVSLFLRLLQAMFRPEKARFTCPECALTMHDPDAVHCKHCGVRLKIRNEGL